MKKKCPKCGKTLDKPCKLAIVHCGCGYVWMGGKGGKYVAEEIFNNLNSYFSGNGYAS